MSTLRPPSDPIEDYGDPGPIDLQTPWHRLRFQPPPDTGELVEEDIPLSGFFPSGESVFASHSLDKLSKGNDIFAVFTTGRVLFLSDQDMQSYVDAGTVFGRIIDSME